MNEEAKSSSSSASESGTADESGSVEKPTYTVEDVETYEGVSADDFAAYSAMVEVRLDALVASSAVVVVALFVCAGVMAVETLMRSLERF